MGKVREITFYVTSKCNLKCHECIMKHFMEANAKYEMSLKEIDFFLKASEKYKYKFNFILSGGEPLMWGNLEDGLRKIRNSPVCNTISIFSNAINISNLNKIVINLIDQLRVSEYTNNMNNIAIIKKKYKHKVRIVDRTEFWPNPTEPVPNTLPPECLNYPQHLYMNYKLYACPHSGSIAEFNKSDVPLYTSLDGDFIKRIDAVFQSQQAEICNMCISNQKVRNKVVKIKNTNKRSQI